LVGDLDAVVGEDVGLGQGEVHDDAEDGGEEDQAGHRRAEAQPALGR